jgi:hypothetical protein
MYVTDHGISPCFYIRNLRVQAGAMTTTLEIPQYDKHHHRRRLSRIRPLGFFRFRIYFLKLMNVFRHLVGLLGRGISPTQGLYLPRTTQGRKMRTHIHASSRIRTHDPSVRAAEVSTCLRPLGQNIIQTTINDVSTVTWLQAGRASFDSR